MKINCATQRLEDEVYDTNTKVGANIDRYTCKETDYADFLFLKKNNATNHWRERWHPLM